jgi:hypothetical protein
MDDEPLISRAAIALLALVLLGASVSEPASAKEVPKQITPTATVTPSPTNSPTPTVTRIPEPTPTITTTPTPTLSPVVEITANHTVNRVLPWLGEIERINKNEDLKLDPVLVLAVMAAESGGDHSVVSYASACGLMQVIPRHYHELSAYDICHSRVGNIYQGMYILRWALDFAESEGLSLEYGVSFYNCSVDGVMNDRCGSQGGLNYADNVLNFWYPRFILALEE